MSATLGDVTRFEKDLARRTGRPTAVVSTVERPVPLHYEYVTTPLLETIEERLATHQAPIYVVHFSRAAAIEQAQALNSLRVCTREEKDQIADLIGGFRFTAGFGRTLSRLVRNGIGVHHAGMLPKYRRLVELLAQAGLLKIICGTDTLGVGINVPIRTVLLTSLSKYDGVRPRLLTAREFHQIGGRAGRAGYDAAGTVHRAGSRSRGGEPEGPGQGRRRPEEAPQGRPQEAARGHRRLRRTDVRAADQRRSGAAGVLVRGQPCDAAERDQPPRRLFCRDASPADRERRTTRPAARRTSTGRCRSIAACSAPGVVEQLPEPDALGRTARLTVDLQPEFALNQPLSPFALAAFDLLDREADDYPLDVLSVIESTLEDPRPVLQRAAIQGPGRGRRGHETRGPGVRGADGTARGRHLSAPAAPSCSGSPTRRTPAPTRGFLIMNSSPNRWPGTSTSGR